MPPLGLGGDRREPIFVDDEDRQGLLEVVAQALSRFDAEALSYCLIGYHYHFVLHTRQANLSLLGTEPLEWGRLRALCGK